MYIERSIIYIHIERSKMAIFASSVLVCFGVACCSALLADAGPVLPDQRTRRTSEYVALREKYVALPVKKIIVFGPRMI